MTDALVPVDVAALERLPLDDQIDALGAAYRSWRRLEVPAAWAFGRALRIIREGKPGREWSGVRDRIGIARETARRYMELADGYDSAQIGQFPTVDAALKALGPKRLAPAPSPSPAPAIEEPLVEQVVEHPVEHPVEQVVEEQVASVEHPFKEEHSFEEEVEEVAAEAEPTPAELRDERLERLAIITEHIDVDGGEDVVDAWARKFDRQAAEHREAVATINTERRATAAERRKNRDICDALLELPPLPEVDALLAKFYNVARPAA